MGIGPRRTLRAGRDERVEGDGVGLAALLVHLPKEADRHLPVAGLLARADEAGERDHRALALLVHHFVENSNRLRTGQQTFKSL